MLTRTVWGNAAEVDGFGDDMQLRITIDCGVERLCIEKPPRCNVRAFVLIRL